MKVYRIYRTNSPLFPRSPPPPLLLPLSLSSLPLPPAAPPPRPLLSLSPSVRQQ